jgi:hypothetical protein
MDSRCKTVCCRKGGEARGETEEKRQLEKALTGAKVVAITMDKEYLHEEASSLKTLAPTIADCCPKASNNNQSALRGSWGLSQGQGRK